MQIRASIITITTCLILLSSNQSYAQIGFATSNSRFEIGFNAGPMNFLGDLGGNRGQGTIGPKDTNIPITNISAGISAT